MNLCSTSQISWQLFCYTFIPQCDMLTFLMEPMLLTKISTTGTLGSDKYQAYITRALRYVSIPKSLIDIGTKRGPKEQTNRFLIEVPFWIIRVLNSPPYFGYLKTIYHTNQKSDLGFPFEFASLARSMLRPITGQVTSVTWPVIGWA